MCRDGHHTQRKYSYAGQEIYRMLRGGDENLPNFLKRLPIAQTLCYQTPHRIHDPCMSCTGALSGSQQIKKKTHNRTFDRHFTQFRCVRLQVHFITFPLTAFRLSLAKKTPPGSSSFSVSTIKVLEAGEKKKKKGNMWPDGYYPGKRLEAQPAKRKISEMQGTREMTLQGPTP